MDDPLGQHASNSSYDVKHRRNLKVTRYLATSLRIKTMLQVQRNVPVPVPIFIWRIKVYYMKKILPVLTSKYENTLNE